MKSQRLPANFPTLKIEVQLFFNLLDKIEYGRIEVITPEKESYVYEGEKAGPDIVLNIHDWQFCTSLMLHSDIGLGKTYIAGDWSCNDLSGLVQFGIINTKAFEKVIRGSVFKLLFFRLKHLLNFNSKKGSKDNISYHYDLGNDFYSQWLDETMTYSSAMFIEGNSADLAFAQKAKYQRIIDELEIKTGEKVLEIGCGWGGFMEHAASKGIEVQGITISKEQLDYANKRMKNHGLSHLAQAEFLDYRDLAGTYDYIVSIEMFEAIGERYWNGFMQTLDKVLSKKGKAVIQTITIKDELFPLYRKCTDFIQQYIFPGGMLPSEKVFNELCTKSHLQIKNRLSFGQSYAKTLNIWEKQFKASVQAFRSEKFNDEFIRMWEFYLKYCEGAFTVKNTDVFQFTLTK